MNEVFITYRREETGGQVARLFQGLEGRLGRGRVFRDVASIEAGQVFTEVIAAALGSCRVALVVIGGRWLSARDADGRRRLDHEDDLVRREIEAVLAGKNVTVIPVLVGEVQMPREEDLPESLKPLAGRHAFRVSTDSDQQWEFDVGLLAERIEGVLGAPQLRPGSPIRAPSGFSLWALFSAAVIFLVALVLQAVREPNFVVTAVASLGLALSRWSHSGDRRDRVAGCCRPKSLAA